MEYEARVADLSNSLERMREERDRARDLAALLEDELAKETRLLAATRADLDRLRRHYEAGGEL
jgi:cell division septum initiation protein DivIVA